MEKIGLDKLAQYYKYDEDEAMGLHERGVDKSDSYKISSEEFRILYLIQDNLVMLRTNKCSKEFAQKLELEIEYAKSKVTQEVFESLQKNDKPKIETPNWFKRIFGKR